MCSVSTGSSLYAPDEWGELVLSKTFNPSFPTLKVGHLVAFMFYHVSVSLFQCDACAVYSLCVGDKSLSSVLGELVST